MTKGMDALPAVKTSAGIVSRLHWQQHADVSTVIGRTWSAEMMSRQRVIPPIQRRNVSDGVPEPQVFHSATWAQRIMVSITARTACRYLQPRQAGELLRDSKVSKGENVRDHRPSSTVVSAVIPHIFTSACDACWIDPGPGDACK
ncbi:hypothetical protein [Burkholderia cepacia]|uniref:hypothetical protein n=1 Tax=Burkholderia cepacia TaxID=292 RepID=UPI0012D8D477|nr:hypothetical protein [Burkholderia cepacia]